MLPGRSSVLRRSIYPSADLTRAGLGGRSRTLGLPVALAKALATAATAALQPSPEPSGAHSNGPISSISTLGALRHGEDRIARPVARQNSVRSKRTSSFSVQLTDWTMPPSIWLVSPSGLMIKPEIDGRPGLRHTDQAGGTVDHDLRHHRDVAGRILVLGKADAAAARTVSLLSVLPASLLGHSLDHGPRPRVFQMCKAESDRIGADRGRELIQKDSSANTLA